MTLTCNGRSVCLFVLSLRGGQGDPKIRQGNAAQSSQMRRLRLSWDFQCQEFIWWVLSIESTGLLHLNLHQPTNVVCLVVVLETGPRPRRCDGERPRTRWSTKVLRSFQYSVGGIVDIRYKQTEETGKSIYDLSWYDMWHHRTAHWSGPSGSGSFSVRSWATETATWPGHIHGLQMVRFATEH